MSDNAVYTTKPCPVCGKQPTASAKERRGMKCFRYETTLECSCGVRVSVARMSAKISTVDAIRKWDMQEVKS